MAANRTDGVRLVVVSVMSEMRQKRRLDLCQPNPVHPEERTWQDRTDCPVHATGGSHSAYLTTSECYSGRLIDMPERCGDRVQS